MLMKKLYQGERQMITDRLKDIREDKDLTQNDIAKILNVKQPTYSSFENGTKIIPLKHLNTLSNFYNVSLDYLTGLSDKRENKNKINELNKNTIGKNIKQVRIDNKLTLRELAKELKTSHSTINAYELGQTLILTAFAYQICKKYKVSLDWLCGK